MKKYSELITESINDKNLLKACILAGGTGSGKSFISDKTFKGLPVVFINKDEAFEYKMHKAGLSLKMQDLTDDEIIQKDIIRKEASKITKSQSRNWIDSLLPVIIDGTGKDYEKMKYQRQVLIDLGYDVSMLFVNTSLEVAMERNLKRSRTVPPEIAKAIWLETQKNVGRFQSLFTNDGGQFQIIDNSVYLSGPELVAFEKKLTKIAFSMINSPLKNRTGKQLLDQLKKQGLKYRSDINPEFLNII